MSEKNKIRLEVHQNSFNTEQGISILIDRKCKKKQMLQCCSEALSVKARRLFNDSGNELLSFSDISEGTHIYVSQGEDFKPKPIKFLENL